MTERLGRFWTPPFPGPNTVARRYHELFDRKPDPRSKEEKSRLWELGLNPYSTRDHWMRNLRECTLLRMQLIVALAKEVRSRAELEEAIRSSAAAVIVDLAFQRYGVAFRELADTREQIRDLRFKAKEWRAGNTQLP